MNKFFTILTACMLMALSMKAQWIQTLTGQKSVSGQSDLIDAISVVNDNVIWIQDQSGNEFSITLDGGKTWTTKGFPALTENKDFADLTAVTDKVAYAVLSQSAGTFTHGIYITTDGGDTWVRQATAFNSLSSFPDLVHFWNENEGVAIGDGIGAANGILEVYTTTNGGAQWNPVPAANMPVTAPWDWTFNGQSFIRVNGNTVYIMGGTSTMYKSTNKGLNWTAITTPTTRGTDVSFDFKDDSNGLLSNYNQTTKVFSVYSTANGGGNWTLINSTSMISQIKYIPSLDVYFSANTLFSAGSAGFSYSADNGVTWTKHPSFIDVGMKQINYTPSGNIFIGGWGYMYNTTNYTGVNLSLNKSKLTGTKNIDLTFSSNLDVASAQDITNYLINYRMNNVATYTDIALLSATVDPADNAVVHLVTSASLPIDTCYIKVLNVKAINGISVINNSKTSRSNVINTSLKDYSNVKYALIGTGYYLNNVPDGAKAVWNICWKDALNNIQASVPLISENGKVFTWIFPAVWMNGGANLSDGMFKFCIPYNDNTPNWIIEPIGSEVIDSYTGSAIAEVDRVSDINGALSILTSGLTKKYDIRLIIDHR